MNKEIIFTGVLIEDTTTYTAIEVCQKYHIPQELLIEMIEHGLFPRTTTSPEQISFDAKALRRMESAFRLHNDLGINLPGVTLALELLDEIEKIHSELNILRQQIE